MDNHSGKTYHTQIILWSLLSLMPIIGVSIDIITPSLPAITRDVSTSVRMAKNIISLYLLGYAAGNFIMGFLTDALGRQKFLRLALFTFAAISLLPLLIKKIEIILLVRVIQGFSIGAVAVIIRGVMADILPLEKLVKIGTLIGTMWGIGPIVGPVIGAYLQFYFGWQANFCFLSLIAFIGFITVYINVPETSLDRQILNLKTLRNNFYLILTHSSFMSLVILTGLSYSLVIIFQTLGPFLIQETLHYSPVAFGHMALSLGLFFLLGTFASRVLQNYFRIKYLYLFFITFFWCIALIGVILNYFNDKNITLIITISAMMFFANGSIFPMSMGKGLSFFRQLAGSATAVMYLINTLITSISSFVVSLIKNNNSHLLMFTYLILMTLALIIYWMIIHHDDRI